MKKITCTQKIFRIKKLEKSFLKNKMHALALVAPEPRPTHGVERRPLLEAPQIHAAVKHPHHVAAPGGGAR